MANSSSRSIVNIAMPIPIINAGIVNSDTIDATTITASEFLGNPTLDLTGTTSIVITSPSITLGNTGTAIEVGEDSGNSQLGFFGNTPIVQPTTGITALAFVANTSTIANDTATYGGYTIGQLAATLKNLGFLE